MICGFCWIDLSTLEGKRPPLYMIIDSSGNDVLLKGVSLNVIRLGTPLRTVRCDRRWAVPPTLWHGDSRNALLAAEDLQEQQMKIRNELSLSASNARVLLHCGRTRLMKMVNRFEETGSC